MNETVTYEVGELSLFVHWAEAERAIHMGPALQRVLGIWKVACADTLEFQIICKTLYAQHEYFGRLTDTEASLLLGQIAAVTEELRKPLLPTRDRLERRLAHFQALPLGKALALTAIKVAYLLVKRRQAPLQFGCFYHTLGEIVSLAGGMKKELDEEILQLRKKQQAEAEGEY